MFCEILLKQIIQIQKYVEGYCRGKGTMVQCYKALEKRVMSICFLIKQIKHQQIKEAKISQTNTKVVETLFVMKMI